MSIFVSCEKTILYTPYFLISVVVFEEESNVNEVWSVTHGDIVDYRS